MTGPVDHTCRKTESALIVGLISARLDWLEGSDESAVSAAETRLAGWPGGARITKLLVLFGCDKADRAVLLTALAPQLDPRLIARYDALTGRPWATEWLAARLFDFDDQPLLHSGTAVAMWRLVRERAEHIGDPPALEADPAIRGWVSGHLGIEPDLMSAFRPATPESPLAGWPVKETVVKVRAAIGRGERAVMLVEGLAGSGRTTFAASVAEALGQRCFVVDPAAAEKPWGQTETLRAHRFALVAGAALAWRGSPPKGALWLAGLWPPALQSVALDPGDTAPDPGMLAPFTVTLPGMERAERARMLAERVPASAGWTEETRATLAGRRALTPAALVRLGRIAPEDDEAALEAANRSYALMMGDLAVRVPGTLDWDDLVLPPALKENLKNLAFEARMRGETWGDPKVRRLFAREAGMVALFQGPPGTGKTMAAQVVARALGYDLYRIDCSAVISKYIGETAKNLGAIFARVRRIDAVLFFDEADALFTRRTEVKDSNDRHANSDTSHLLQLIESAFDGTAILATNRITDMEHAFLRRIRYTFEFPRPSAEERTEIWNRAATALIPDRAAELAPLWAVLGAHLDITGAQIKTTLLSAHFASARRGEPLGTLDLAVAAEREFGKEGRTLGAREKERIYAHA